MNSFLCRSLLIALHAWLVVLLGFPCAAAQSPVKVQSEAGPPKPSICVRLLNTPVVIVDPVTGSGEALLLLTNQIEKEVNVALLGGVNSPPNSPTNVEFSRQTGGSSGPLYEAKLNSKGTIILKILVHDVWDDGEFDVDLTNHYGTEKVGKVHVKRIPVGIKLEGMDRLKLTLVDGVQTRIMLRNDDPRAYAVTWRLINGEDVCDGPANPVSLNAKTLVALECMPKLPWGFARFANLLKPDQSHDGYRLLLLPQSYPSNAKSATAIHALKAFQGEATLDYFTSLNRGIFSYPILATILLLGGLSSLILSYFVPNKLKRLTLRDQLLELAARTADLSTRIDSKLSVLVRLERNRLSDLLKSRSPISPDFSTVATECSAGITRLTQKVAVLEQMDLALNRLEKKIAQGAPPTQLCKINDKLQLAAVLLGKSEISDAEIQAGTSAVSDAATGIDNLNQPDDTFATSLSQGIRDLVTDIDQTLSNSTTYQAIVQKLPGPMRALRSAMPLTTVPADKYVQFDTASKKMGIVREYVSLVEEATDNDRIARLTAREAELVARLEVGTWPALRSASLLLREMRDDVFPERIVEVLRLPDEAFINVDPPLAYERSPLELSICFQRAALNTAAAREEIEVEWAFGDGLTGKGWSVCHYFQIKRKRNSYELRVTFRGPNGEPLTDAGGRLVAVERTVVIEPSEIGRGVGERTRLELLKLGIALVVAVFGLVSGAQDQIARLDLLPGIIAVFLVGFSADSIKRLLTT